MKTAQNLLGGNITSGLKASQSVTTDEQGKPAEQRNQETFNKMLHGEPTDPPKGAYESAERLNQQTAKGLLHGTIKPEPKPEVAQDKPTTPAPRSYAEMFAELNKGMKETPYQQKKRERKERTDAIVRSVGDGLSAIARMYYATKGAQTAHNPQNDLTAVANKRREYLEAQREKNKDAWLTGYQRALALDEEARNNNMTAAETFRYHNMLRDIKERGADQGDRRLDQGDRRLDQGQQKLDLTKYKYDTDKEYNDAQLKIRQQLADGQITRWQAQTAINEMTEQRLAAKGGSSGSGKQTAAGYWNEYYDAMSTPEGKAKIQRIISKNPALRGKVNQNSVRFIMDIYYGRKSSGGKKTPPKTPKKQKASTKKKPTGVNWK